MKINYDVIKDLKDTIAQQKELIKNQREDNYILLGLVVIIAVLFFTCLAW